MVFQYTTTPHVRRHGPSGYQDVRSYKPWLRFGHHLEVRDDGTMRGLTPSGVALIRICRLDRPKLTAFRRGMLEVWRTLERRHGSEAAAMRQRFFGFPANLPHLATLRPPTGNTHPQGLAQSYYARQQRGTLPPTY